MTIYEKIFQESPVVSQIFTPEGTLVAVNRAWRRLWGVNSDDRVGEYNVFADPQLADTGQVAFRRALAGEHVIMPPYRYDPATSGLPGRPRWLRTHLFASHDAAGRVEAVVVLHEDVSDEQRALARYQAMVENASEAVLVVQEGRLVYANPVTLALTNHDEEAIRNRPFLDFVHPDDRPLVGERYRRRLAGEPVTPQFRIRVLDRDGATIWLEGRASVIDWDGEPAVLALCINVTDRVLMEEELRQSEARFRAIAQSCSDMIHLNGADGTLLFVNRATERLLGYKAADLLGRPATDIVHPDDRERVVRDMAEVAAGRDFQPLVIRLLKADGAPLPVEVLGFASRGEGGEPLLGAVIRDVTERLATEEAREQRLQSLGLLAGGIAHDFNNLLTALTGNLSLMRLAVEEGAPLLENIGEMERACERARRLTGQLLTFSRGGSPVKATTDLASVVRESASFVLRGSPVAVRFEIAADLWAAEADGGQIGQVIQNLVLNGAQAMAGGGTITVTARNRTLARAEVEDLAPGPYVEIAVTDQGVGIPAAHLDRIFDPYFSTKDTGSGLGLAAAYAIVRKHQGIIQVDSTPGEGSTFRLLLPATGQPPPERRAEAEEVARGQGDILVMDDDGVLRKLVESMAQVLGYRATTAADGAEAVEHYRRRLAAGTPFGAVILDLTVPGGMGGVAAAAEILALDPAARLVASSGYANDDVLARYQEFGFQAVLPKPYRIKDLGRVLAALLPPAGSG